MKQYALYSNTIAEAQRIGWDKVPEHTLGDPTCQFVLHDPVEGKFYYIDVERR